MQGDMVDSRRPWIGRTSSRRRVIGVGAGGVGAALLAACGEGGGVPAGAPKELAPASLVFWHGGGGDTEMAPKRAADFMAEHPNIKVTVEDPGDLGAKVLAGAAAGTLADLMLQSASAGQPQILFLRKIVQGIDQYIQRDKLDLKQWYPHIIEAARVDGKQFALPFDGKVARVAVWVNKTMFDKAGLKLPDLNWTVDQYMDAAVKLNRPDA